MTSIDVISTERVKDQYYVEVLFVNASRQGVVRAG